MTAWKAAQPFVSVSQSTTLPTVNRSVQWSPPGLDVLKVNCDAAINPTPSSFLGFLVRDSNSQCRAWGRKEMPGIADPTMAEKLALRFAALWIHSSSDDQFVLEGDCQSALLELDQGLKNPEEVGCPIIDHIIALLYGKSVLISFVPREGNVHAHNVAKGCNLYPDSCRAFVDYRKFTFKKKKRSIVVKKKY